MTPDEYNQLKAQGFDFDDKDALVQKRKEKDAAYVANQKSKEVELK